MSHLTDIMVSVGFADQPTVEALSRWIDEEAPVRGVGGPVEGRWVGDLAETTGPRTQWGGGKAPGCVVFAGTLNHVDIGGLLAHIASVQWRAPEVLQVFVLDEYDTVFQVWMFQDGRLCPMIGPRAEPHAPQA